MSKRTHLVILPWVIWVLAALFYFYEFILLVSPNVMTNDLMRAFDINATALSILAGAYFIPYSFTQIPVGLFLDKIGPRCMLVVAALLCLLGSYLFASAYSYDQAYLARFITGFGSAFAAVTALKLAANWFPVRRFALMAGLTVSIGMLGAVYGGEPLAAMLDAFQWRETMYILAVVGAIIAILAWVIVRDKPATPIEPELVDTGAPQLGIWEGLLIILKSPHSWALAIYGGLMFLPTTVFGGLWGISFLSAAYDLPRATAAAYESYIFYGWIIGGPILGYVSDAMQRRKPVIYFGTIGALICMSLILYVKMPLFILGLTIFGLGAFSSGFLPSFSIIKETNPHNMSATAMGFMNTLNNFGPVALLPLVGFLLDKSWHGLLQDGVRVYSVEAYRAGLAVLPASILVALLIVPFIKETYCKSYEQQAIK